MKFRWYQILILNSRHNPKKCWVRISVFDNFVTATGLIFDPKCDFVKLKLAYKSFSRNIACVSSNVLSDIIIIILINSINCLMN